MFLEIFLGFRVFRDFKKVYNKLGMSSVKIEDRKYWVLLALEAAQGESLTPVQLQKSLFLFSEKNRIKKDSYKFRPYDYGPFDPDVYRDAEQLEKDGLISISYAQNLKWKVYTITPEGASLSEKVKKLLPQNLIQSISDIINHVRSLSFQELVKEIYTDYPAYSVNSVFRG
jgi:uncharacterized protein